MHRKNRSRLLAAVLTAVSAWSLAAPKTMTLPADAVALRPSTLPGYAKAQASCVACHSADYMLYQPPNASRPYWDAMVRRMKTVFKAPIEDADIPDLVDYLSATYGSQKP